MSQHADLLQDVGNLPSSEIVSHIRALTPSHLNQLPALRAILETGAVFVTRQGESYDSALVQTALLSIVLANVPVYDPYLKNRQMQSIREACVALGLSYDEVLDLTTKEDKIRAVLSV